MRIFLSLITKYVLAAKGWLVFHKVVHQYNRSNTEYVFLFPDGPNDCSYYSLLYLDKFLQKQYANSAILLTTDMTVARSSHLFSKRIRKVIKIAPNACKSLIQYYQLCPFDQRFIIASFHAVEGRDGLELLGKHDITMEELVVIGILGFSEFRKQPPISYTGTDPEIISFISRY